MEVCVKGFAFSIAGVGILVLLPVLGVPGAAIGAPGNATPQATPTTEEANPSPQDVLKIAQRAKADADAANAQASNVVNNANNAVNTVNLLLNFEQEQLDKGVEHLQKSLATDEDYAPAEAALGYALRVQADCIKDQIERNIVHAKSEERLLRALQIDPTALDVHGEPVQAVLGGLYKRQGRVDEAIYRYEEARAIAPDKSYPIVNLAILYYMQGNIAKARAFFTRVEASASITLEQNSFDYWSRFNRLTAALALGKTAEALNDLKIIEQQLKTVSPLESAVGELMRLKSAPQPPVISQIQAMIKRIGRGKGAS